MKFLTTLLLTFFYSITIAQTSDFLVFKKNDRIMKTYYTGEVISFGAVSGYFSGVITAIAKDTIFFTQYDIRQRPTNLGVYVLDTVGTYKLGFNYRDIAYIGHNRSGFNWSASGASLLGGGIILTTVGLGTWVFTKPGTQYYASPALVIGSAALAGVGYLLLKSNHSYKLGNKYHLEYISLTNRKK